jgi:hypothetical protein
MKSIAHSKRENASSAAAPKIHGIYIKSMLETKVYLNITEVGGNIKDNLEKKISSKPCNLYPSQDLLHIYIKL